MKSVLLLLVCLAVASQGRVLLSSKEAIDIPVEIIKEPEPQALPLVKAETETEQEPKVQAEQQKPLEEKLPEEVKPEAREAAAKEEVKEEAKLEAQQAAEEQPKAEIKEAAKPVARKEEQLELKEEPKPEEPQPLAKEQQQQQPEQQQQTETELKPEPQLESQPQPLLKSLPTEEVAQAVPEVVAPVAVVEPEQQLAEDAVQPHVRQATQATPTQSSTQQNFVQQLIQNSPIGQFLSQFNGQPQQGQTQLVAADQPAPAAPTVPGFLQPAVTSAQNAVQNVVNTTTQAFQGIQQFANNLGTQFQNTLSGLTGQNAQPTTARPPGPIQSFVNNVFAGGNNATAASPPQQQQPQGPLQGIINFLGGNRPTNAAPAVAATQAPDKKPAVDDKIEEAQEIAEQPAVSENEVRSSAETIDDSFEEAVPSNEVIVVNDDASAADAAAELATDDAAVPNNSVDSADQQATFVDATAL